MTGRYVRDGEIVHRCGRKTCYFEGPTREALETHYQESSIHGVCLKCWPRPDFCSKEALLNHWKTSEKHNWCDHCDRDFDTANSLKEHRKIHRIRDLECFGCYRRFPSHSAMMIHLESGNCPCGTNDEELRKLAARCYQHNHYIVRGMGSYLQNHQHADAGPEHFNYSLRRYECPECDRFFDIIGGLQQHLSSPAHDAHAFKCPDTDCDKRFTCISGLLQHLESSQCQEVVYGVEAIGKMLHYIATNL